MSDVMIVSIYIRFGAENGKGRVRMVVVIGGAYQGKLAYVKQRYGTEREIIHGLHHNIREFMMENKDPWEEIAKRVEQNPNLIIISNEIGYGLVPMDEFERRYRETTGRILGRLCENATEVIRVVCGIGMQIKGS